MVVFFDKFVYTKDKIVRGLSSMKENISSEVYSIVEQASFWYGMIKNMSLSFEVEVQKPESQMTADQVFSMMFGKGEEVSQQGVVKEYRALTQIDKRDLSLFLAVLSSKTPVNELLASFGVTLDKIADCFPDIHQLIASKKLDDFVDSVDGDENYHDLYTKYFEPMIEPWSKRYVYMSPDMLTLELLNSDMRSAIVSETIYPILNNTGFSGNLLGDQLIMIVNQQCEKFLNTHPEEKEAYEERKRQAEQQNTSGLVKVIMGQAGMEEESFSQIGTYLTDKEFARNPVIGRDKELDEALITLITRSLMLLGPSGVGKTALVEGLAYRMQQERVPECLKDSRILQVNTHDLVAGTIYRGAFEERVQALIQRLREEEKTILFIDEIHTVRGAGAVNSDSQDLMNILKPYLSSGEIRMIGATTEYEYQEYFSNDDAFRRRFDTLTLKEPKEDVLQQIMSGSILKYRDLTGVDFSYSEEDQRRLFHILIRQTNDKVRVYHDKQYNPHLVLSILEKAFAYAAFYEHDSVKMEDLCQAVMSCERIYPYRREIMVSQLNSLNISPNKQDDGKKLIKKQADIIPFRPRG